jgi:hypothetical protein
VKTDRSSVFGPWNTGVREEMDAWKIRNHGRKIWWQKNEAADFADFTDAVKSGFVEYSGVLRAGTSHEAGTFPFLYRFDRS